MKKKTFVLRLSEDMYKELEQWAAAEFRSVNGQIEFVLNRALTERKKAPIPKQMPLDAGDSVQ